MAKDRFDTVTAVYSHPAAVAVRYAMLYELTRWQKNQRFTSATVNRLRDTWRARVGELFDSKAAGPLKDRLVLMRNCHPPGFKFAEKLWWCERPRLCPFCYGRRFVAPAVDRLTQGWRKGLRGFWVGEITVGERTIGGGDIYTSVEDARDRWPRITAPEGSNGGFRFIFPHALPDDRVFLRCLTVVRPGKGQPPFCHRLEEFDSAYDFAKRMGALMRLPSLFLQTPASVAIHVDNVFRNSKHLVFLGRKAPEGRENARQLPAGARAGLAKGR